MKTRIFSFEEYFKNEAKKATDEELEDDDVEPDDENTDTGDDDDDDDDEKPKKKETKVAKGEGVKELLKIFKERPLVKMTSYEDEKGAYTIAGLKNALKDKYSSTQVDQFMYELQNDKEHKGSLKNIRIKEFKNGESYPYFYMGEFDADAYKEKLEKASKTKYAAEHSKKQELIKKNQQEKEEKEKAKEEAKTKRASKPKKEPKEPVEGEEEKPKGKRGRPKKKKDEEIKESIMRFKEFTFGVKEGLNDEIIGADYGIDDDDTFHSDYSDYQPSDEELDTYYYDEVKSILEDEYDYIVNDEEFDEFEEAIMDTEINIDTPEEYAKYFMEYIDGKVDFNE